ncbi:MAG: Gfo/Idh/MocA family oxidoreductase [Fimbriimonadaceae bacterium]|nr:Gfo/Idh/MocA family oxidoreductase [Fimbriimonadaceae bacterium]
MSQPLRVAMIGAGGMASAHLKAIGPFEDAAVVAFCDPDAAKIEARVAELRGIRPDAAPVAYSDPATMLADADPDVVYVLLPPFVHGPAERACLAAGKPFFVEKPIGLEAGLTRELAAEVEQRGLLTCAGYMNRYRAGVSRARELLAADPPALVHGGWIGGAPNPQPGDTNIGSWWVIKEKSGGQIVEQCTHTFDVLRYLCGEAVEVYARAAHGFNTGIYHYTIDDASSVVLQLANGGVANLMSACVAGAGGGGVWLNVYARQTTCLFTGWDHAAKILRKGEPAEEIQGEPDIFSVEDRVFLDAVRSGDGSGIRSTYPDAAKTLLLTLAANESLASGRAIAV